MKYYRLSALSILANQAAIAIEKSELIATLKEAQVKLQNWGRELEEKVKQKTEELVDVKSALEMSLSLVGKDLLVRDIRLVKEMSNVSKILANMDEMKQVFLNLILNATQSMPKGGKLKVQTSMAGEEKIRIRIQDTGLGIAKEDLSEIFNPFFTTKSPGEGTGLGLSLVHSVIESYEGTIQVESRKGKGTSFIMELPVFQEKGQGRK